MHMVVQAHVAVPSTTPRKGSSATSTFLDDIASAIRMLRCVNAAFGQIMSGNTL
jgi:hypothetical protein